MATEIETWSLSALFDMILEIAVYHRELVTLLKLSSSGDSIVWACFRIEPIQSSSTQISILGLLIEVCKHFNSCLSVLFNFMSFNYVGEGIGILIIKVLNVYQGKLVASFRKIYRLTRSMVNHCLVKLCMPQLIFD